MNELTDNLNDPIDINNIIINTSKLMERIENSDLEIKGLEKKNLVTKLIKSNVENYEYADKNTRNEILKFIDTSLSTIINNNISIVNGDINIEKNIDTNLDKANEEFNHFFIKLKEIITDEDLRDITQLVLLATSFYYLLDEITDKEKDKKKILIYCFKRLIIELNNIKPREKRDLVKFVTKSLPDIIENNLDNFEISLDSKKFCC